MINFFEYDYDVLPMNLNCLRITLSIGWVPFSVNLIFPYKINNKKVFININYECAAHLQAEINNNIPQFQ